jgi:hypothetical protein
MYSIKTIPDPGGTMFLMVKTVAAKATITVAMTLFFYPNSPS